MTMVEPMTKEDQVLEDLLTGTRSEDDPDIRAAMAADPSLQERWRRLQTRAASLDAIGEKDAQQLAEELERRGYDPAQVLRNGTRRQGRLLSFGRTAAAVALVAAAVVVAGLWLNRPNDTTGGVPGGTNQTEIYLGGGSTGSGSYEPSETLAAEQPFRWDAGGLEGVTSWHVTIYEPTEGGEARFVTETSLAADVTTWTPSAELFASLPATFAWAVEWMDAESQMHELFYESAVQRVSGR